MTISAVQLSIDCSLQLLLLSDCGGGRGEGALRVEAEAVGNQSMNELTEKVCALRVEQCCVAPF